tara:strand:- start:27 stop:464 length:438 start_codon:yes stop_codon:yes gene_type:complete
MEYRTTPSGVILGDTPTHLAPEYEIYEDDQAELEALRIRKDELRREVAREKQGHRRTLEVLLKSSEDTQACQRELRDLRAALEKEKAELAAERGRRQELEQEKAAQAQELEKDAEKAQGGGYRKRKSTKKRRKKSKRKKTRRKKN